MYYVYNIMYDTCIMYIINRSCVLNSLIFKVGYFRKHVLVFIICSYNAVLGLTLYMKKYFMSGMKFVLSQLRNNFLNPSL